MNKPWRWEFEENGGYDCMTDAILIYDSNYKVIAELDLRNFGQRSCEPIPPGALERAEAVADFICTASGAQSRL